MKRVLKSYIEHVCGVENVTTDVPLSTKTSFKIGGAAKFFVVVKSKEKLVRLISALNFIGESFFIIGGGTNILASDSGYAGVIIKLGFCDIVDNQTFLYADAGANLNTVVNFAKYKGLSGLEWAVGIPGTVGGAVYMNAGAYGGDVSQVVTLVDVLVDGKIETMDATKLEFEYRSSIFQRNRDWVILGVYFYLRKRPKKEIEEKQLEFLQKRISTNPKLPNAGSIFKKPSEDFYVGKAIEELGLKGYKVGGAMVSKEHAGFIVNKGKAKSEDVEKLIVYIKNKVKKKHGVELEEEIVRV